MKKKITLDGVLSFFILAAMTWAIYEIYSARTVPFKWRMIAIAIVAILSLLFVLLSLKKFPKWATWMRRIISVILVITLGLGSFYIAKVGVFTRKITNVKGAAESISIVVRNDSAITSLSDLEEKTIGVQTGNDKENGKYVQKKLAKDVSDVTYVEDENYIALADQLLNGEIDALIVSDAYINSLNDWQEDFSARITKIKTYSRSVKNIEKDHTGSNLDLTKDCFTVLVSGMDETGDPNHNSRSDVIMLLIINPQTRVVQMASFPRDAYLPNPALNYGNDKLTHTGNDGVENTMLAVENVVGFDIDFYAKVNFTSVVEIVDALGGVEVDVPIAFCEQDSERNFENLQCLNAGVQKVNGEQALAFARHRKTEGVGDIGRTKAQQQVLTAMIKKAMTADGLKKIPDLLDILPKYVVTNVSAGQLENFISYQLENMGSWSIEQMSLENGINASLTTASMGNTPLSCNVLSRYDIRLLFQKHHLIYNPVSYHDFAFDLNDLSLDAYNTPEMELNSNIVYADNDLSPYVGAGDPIEDIPEEEIPVEEDLPEEDLPADPDPSLPEEGGGDNTPENPGDGGEVTPPPVDPGDGTNPPGDGNTPAA